MKDRGGGKKSGQLHLAFSDENSQTLGCSIGKNQKGGPNFGPPLALPWTVPDEPIRSRPARVIRPAPGAEITVDFCRVAHARLTGPRQRRTRLARQRARPGDSLYWPPQGAGETDHPSRPRPRVARQRVRGPGRGRPRPAGRRRGLRHQPFRGTGYPPVPGAIRPARRDPRGPGRPRSRRISQLHPPGKNHRQASRDAAARWHTARAAAQYVRTPAAAPALQPFGLPTRHIEKPPENSLGRVTRGCRKPKGGALRQTPAGVTARGATTEKYCNPTTRRGRIPCVLSHGKHIDARTRRNI